MANRRIVNQHYPPRLENKFYLTAGGTETEVLYKWGYELPEFAMFTLLDNEEANECVRKMYRRYFELAAKNNTGLVIEGHDYRASPDWAATKIGIPIGISLTLNTESRLSSGPTLREAIETIDEKTEGAAAWFGTNCSHPLEFEPAISDEGSWRERLRLIRPNAAKMEKLSLCKLGHLEDGDPVELGAQMGDVASRFPALDIIGGCCGTDERHLHEIAKKVNAVRRAS